MALKPCRECGKEVSASAKTCPHCGVANPVKQASGCFPIILVIVLLAIIGGMFASNSSTTTSLQSSGQSAQSSNPPASTCSSDWHACKDNGDLVNNYQGWSSVQSACQNKVDSEVQYGEPKWPSMWSGGAFGSYYPGTSYISTGIAIAIENNVQIENAFGAMVHSTAICRYDLNSQAVLDASWSPD